MNAFDQSPLSEKFEGTFLGGITNYASVSLLIYVFLCICVFL